MSQSTQETGHNKNLQNFKRFIKFCERNTPPYNPVKEKNKLTNLKKLSIKAEKAHKKVIETNAPIITLTNSRQTLYQPMKSLSTRVIQALDGITEDKKVVKDARRYINKIHGKFSKPQTQDDLEGQETMRTISNSQQSYDSLRDHLFKLIELLRNVPEYIPNEEDLTIDTLQAYLDQLVAVEDQITELNGPYNAALNERDMVFYETEESLVPVTQSVKTYLKSLFGIKSLLYDEASQYKFKTYKRKNKKPK